MRYGLFIAAVLAGVQAAGRGQTSPAPTGEPSPLSGPNVPEESGSGRVRRDFEGKMKPLEVRPEIAALDEIALSTDERAKVDEILARRSATMSRLIRENIELLLKAQAVREGNDPEARRALAAEFRQAFAPLSEDGPLSEQIAGVLTDEHRRRFEAINREYWRELMGQAPAGGEMEDGGARRGRAALERAARNVLRQEVRRAYEQMIADGKQRIDEVVARLELSAEQEARVRAIITEFGQKTKLNPSAADRAELFGKVAELLTPEQRRKAFEMVRGER